MKNEEQNLNEAQTGNSVKSDISGSISVNKANAYGQVQIASNSNFFKTERIIVKVFENEN